MDIFNKKKLNPEKIYIPQNFRLEDKINYSIIAANF